MSDIFFNELGMKKPDHHLGIGGGSHGAMTGRMLIEIERVLLSEKPDTVLVYGDTNSTLAGAVAAAKLGIRLAHVEAGLRSFNMTMPEEINRILTDRVSDLLFTPTETAIQNLRNEGVVSSKIIPVGDVMYDAAIYHGERAKVESQILSNLGLSSGGYVLATIHRAENTENLDRLKVIVDAFCDFSSTFPIVWPIHPRTLGVLKSTGLDSKLGVKVLPIDPVGYLDMIQLEKNSILVATDSGGVQKESFFHRVPCVTLRDETEWGELVDSGWNHLAPPTSSSSVVEAMRSAVKIRGSEVTPYGNGDAARLISKALAG